MTIDEQETRTSLIHQSFLKNGSYFQLDVKRRSFPLKNLPEAKLLSGEEFRPISSQVPQLESNCN